MKAMKIVFAVFFYAWTLPAYAELYREVRPGTGTLILSNKPIRPANTNAPPARVSKPPPLPRPDLPVKQVEQDDMPEVSSGPSFKVSPKIQQFRDYERREILRVELDHEKRKLDSAVTSGAPEEQVNRHRSNIAALEREIRNTK